MTDNLHQDIGHIKAMVQVLVDDVSEIKEKVNSHENWKNTVLGGAVALSIVCGLFISGIKEVVAGIVKNG
jgi:hypothetical protein